MDACRANERPRSVSRYPPAADAGRGVDATLADTKSPPVNGENDAWTTSVFNLRASCTRFDLPPRDCPRSGDKRQKLPHGAAMSLGELQEDMHVCESLPVAGGAGEHYELSAAATSCNSARSFFARPAPNPAPACRRSISREPMKNGRVVSGGFHRRAGF